jgi:hypothetical protein
LTFFKQRSFRVIVFYWVPYIKDVSRTIHPTPRAGSFCWNQEFRVDFIDRGPFYYLSGCFMKSLLRAGIAGICLIIPGVSVASTVSFEVTGSGYTLLFDPQGSGPSTLPPSYDYRSYDCRIGSKPTLVVVFTPPPKTETFPGDNNPPAGPKLPVIQPVIPDPIVCPTNPAAVPLPASSEMAGAGLAVAAIFSWMRSRRAARA